MIAAAIVLPIAARWVYARRPAVPVHETSQRVALTAKAYPMRADGITLFPFRRLFIVARRA